MFVAAMTAIARDLSVLAASGGQLGAQDLDCALAGHAQVVELLVTVHDDLVGRRIRPEVARDAALLDTDPVGLLARLLRDHPRSDVGVATTDLLADAAASPTGRCWQRILKNATVASHAWRDAERQSLPRGAVAWTVMADLAATAQTLACVTPRVATAARRAGRDPMARALTGAACGALWRAAAEVRALADLGPLPPVPEPRQRARLPVRVRQAEALPEAQARLRSLLRQATWLSPAHVEQIAAVQILCLQTVAGSLAPRQAQAATRLARALKLILRHPGTLAAVYQGDQRAVVQAQEIHGYLAKTRLIPPDLLDPYEVWAAAVPSTVEELCAAVGRHVWLGRWLVPDPANPGQWRAHPRPAGAALTVQPRDPAETRLITAARYVAYTARAAAGALQPLAMRATAGYSLHTARQPSVPTLPAPTRRSAHPGRGPVL